MKFLLPDLKNIGKKHKFLLGILILVILLRLPLLFEPLTYADEGIYLTLGQAVRKGLVLYRDIHDNKPPMLYLIAALAGSFPIYRLIHFLWSFATIFAFYKLSQLIFLKNQKAVIFSTSIFAILTSLHTFEGNIANAENFMLLPIIIGFFIFLKFIDKEKVNIKYLLGYFLAGFLFSFAVLFKVPALFDFLAALILGCLAFTSQKQKNYSLFIIHYSLFILGFALPILISIVYFAANGALNQYLTAAFFQNLPYLSSWGGERIQIGRLPLPLAGRALGVVLITILLFAFRKRLSLPVKLTVVWFPFSLFAALLSSRPYPHYLIQVLPSFSLAFGFLAFDKTKKWLKSIPVFLGLVFVLTFVSFHFWYYPNLSYLTNFYQFAFGIKSYQDYFSDFDKQTPSLYETATFIRTHTEPEEKIFIWGTWPSVYALSERLPVGRYTVSYHIIDFNAYEETMKTLRQNPPHFIINPQDEKRLFPQLENFIQDYYTLFKQINEAKIFLRLSKRSRL